MDVLTAKTLVSAILVFAIALFSIASFEAFFTEIARDLRSVRAGRPQGAQAPGTAKTAPGAPHRA